MSYTEIREQMNFAERGVMHRVNMAIEAALEALNTKTDKARAVALHRDEVAPYFSRLEGLLAEARRLAGEAAADMNAQEFA